MGVSLRRYRPVRSVLRPPAAIPHQLLGYLVAQSLLDGRCHCLASGCSGHLRIGIPDFQEPLVVFVLHFLGVRLHDPLLPWLEESHPCARCPEGPHQESGNYRVRYWRRHGIGLHIIPLVRDADVSVRWLRNAYPESWPRWCVNHSGGMATARMPSLRFRSVLQGRGLTTLAGAHMRMWSHLTRRQLFSHGPRPPLGGSIAR